MNIVDPNMERQVPDKTLHVSAGSDVTLTMQQRKIFATGASNPRTYIRFPNVSEAEGREFVISATAVAATAAIQVVYTDGGLGSFSQGIETTGIELTFKSIGKNWVITRHPA